MIPFRLPKCFLSLLQSISGLATISREQKGLLAFSKMVLAMRRRRVGATLLSCPQVFDATNSDKYSNVDGVGE